MQEFLMRLFTIDEIKKLDNLQLNRLDNEIRSCIYGSGVSLTDEAFLLNIKNYNMIGMELFKRKGFFKNWDEKGPIGPDITVKLSDYQNKTLAHVLHDLGFFPSISAARKNGWDKPVEVGTFTFKRRSLVIIN